MRLWTLQCRVCFINPFKRQNKLPDFVESTNVPATRIPKTLKRSKSRDWYQDGRLLKFGREWNPKHLKESNTKFKKESLEDAPSDGRESIAISPILQLKSNRFGFEKVNQWIRNLSSHLMAACLWCQRHGVSLEYRWRLAIWVRLAGIQETVREQSVLGH